MKRTTQEMRLRSLAIGLVLVGLLITLIGRLFWIQGVKAEAYTEQAKQMWEKQEVLQPKRGKIADRDGHVFAQEAPAFTIAVYLPVFRTGGVSPEEAAAQLAPLLKMEEKEIAKRLSREDVDQVELKTSGFSFKISKDVKEQVMELDIKGVHAIPTSKRYYLNDSLAAHVIGFINNEGDPVMGVEKHYNKWMEGTPGKSSFSKDGKGMELGNRDKTFDPPVNGNNIVLTIDRRVQDAVEKALDKAVKEWSPESATAIVMNPNNGEILAMANRPTFNPNEFYNAEPSDLVNMATESVYEPGSTFKIITLAAALEEGQFNPNATYRSGSIEIENEVLHDWNPSGWGDITYADGVQLSSNVAFVRLQQAMGKKFDTYIEQFGFGPYGKARTGTPTGIDLTEARALMPDPERLKYSRLERATTAYGHGISVTPIQLITAFSAALNGGTLYQPQLVKAVRHAETDEVLEEIEPLVIRDHIVSEDTSAKLRELLRSVVVGEKGTGKNAAVPGYDVGGKTGTATKYHSPHAFVSFVSFAPVEDPQVILYIALDEPKSGDPGGGRTAAPLAREIFEKILPVLQVQPQSADKGEAKEASPEGQGEDVQDTVILPDLESLSVHEMEEKLQDLPLKVEVLGAGDKVLHQVPEAGAIETDKTVYVLTEKPSAVIMPDLRQKSLREAAEMCAMLELDVHIEGEGYVYAQSIKPGERLLKKETIHLSLKPNSEGQDERRKGQGKEKEDNPQ